MEKLKGEKRIRGRNENAVQAHYERHPPRKTSRHGLALGELEAARLAAVLGGGVGIDAMR